MKMPSKVPAPPILATGAPRRGMTRRLARSAPIKVPSTPECNITEDRRDPAFRFPLPVRASASSPLLGS